MSRSSIRRAAATGIVLLLLFPALQAQEESPEKEQTRNPGWIAPDLPPSAYVEGEPPPPVDRVFDKSPSRVWKKLVRLLEEEGLVTSTLDRKSGAIETELKIFDEVKGPFKNVATRPPIATKQRPIRQWVNLNRGRYALQISVTPGEKTRVTIKAYIEERAYHIGESVKLWAERHSNGTIENYFLDKLEQAL